MASRKRQSPLDAETPQKKRQKTSTNDSLAKEALRRSIALVLDKIGFDGADAIAIESFVAQTEAYLQSLVEDIATFSHAARRNYAIPTDFERAIKRFNLTTAALKPHVKPPVSRSKRLPKWELLELPDTRDVELPILGRELDGAAERAAKAFIPSTFPSFPSLHTYKHTPELVEAVTVSEDWGEFSPDAVSQSITGPQARSQAQTRPLAADEIPRGDPKKIREAAAKEAKLGEAALRGLGRATRIAKQKDVWSTAQRDPLTKERYNLWEAAMRELIEEDQKSRGNQAAVHGALGRFEIADHSTIVNSEAKYHRQIRG